MSVPKSKRKLSDLEFYKTAIRLRMTVTKWLLRDFGLKVTTKHIDSFSRRAAMSDEDKASLREILDRYSLGDRIMLTYPDWWVSERRKRIDVLLANAIGEIRIANSIYPTSEEEFFERRIHQDRAIGNLEAVSEEFNFVVALLYGTNGVDVERYMPIVNMLSSEIVLLKGWRKSDNRTLTKIRKGRDAKTGNNQLG